MPKLFCFGFGYSAQALATRLRGAGWFIAGTHRTPDAVNASREKGIDAHVFSADHPLTDPAAALEGVSHVLVSISPEAGAGDPVLAAHGDALKSSGVQWIGYISSTVVYGDHNGAWVDEFSELRTTQPRGRARIDAENAWAALGDACGAAVQIFRCAGIYGPGRNALETLQSGTARRIVKPGQVTSRIHVDDIAQVLAASIARPRAGGIYNLADDYPCPPAEVLDYAAALLGVPPAPTIAFDDLPADSPSRKFMTDNRRVRNNRIKQELGVRLLYPTYGHGLDALLAARHA